MSPIVLMVVGLAMFAFGYLVYSRYLAKRVFASSEGFVTPAHELRDGVDYEPTNKFILWGHHFTSVAGAAPIVGPAIAIIWGWGPAFLWVTLGTVFFAGMHDMGTLWASVRNKGRSIGSLSERYIGKRGSALFLVVMFILLLMVIAAFAVVITNLLIATPSSVIPTWGALVVALGVGFSVYRMHWPLIPVTIVGVIALYALIYLGDLYPVVLPENFLGMGPAPFWILCLFVYGGAASLLPVWVLLQPRDYINGVQLFIGLGILYGAVIGAAFFAAEAPKIVAPFYNTNLPENTPNIVPLLFVTIACGAISGFHGLVSSGTSSKQLDKESDSRLVGYFGAVGEGLLALATILVVAGGFRTVTEWNEVYSSFGEAGVATFIQAGGDIMNTGLGLPVSLSATVLATMTVLFAATSLDTAMRLFRLIVQEIGDKVNVRINKVAATVIALGLGMALTFSQGASGEGGLRIWPLFGTTNQLLAALSLAMLTVVLIRKRRNPLPTLIPLIVVFSMSFWAAIAQLMGFVDPEKPDWLLFALDCLIIVSSLLVAVEAILAIRRALKEEPEPEDADMKLEATRERV